MKTILELYTRNKRLNHLLFLFSCYCLSLSFIRVKLTTSIYLLFLIWNLFLAIIPFLITTYLKTINPFNVKIKSVLLIITWLLFLPNSFYIITDFVHLTLSNKYTFWYDLLLISSYSSLGFLLGILSLKDFEDYLLQKLSQKFSLIIIFGITILCGFGIYMGRILRYNSWDILQNPMQLFSDLFEVFGTKESVAFSFLFGLFIYFFYQVSKYFNITIKQ